jgi:hypothetical protein
MQLLTLVPKAPNRKRHRLLFLELLEPRCVPSTVTNLSDHDPGSLRDAIVTTPDGGTVDFQPGLTGTITLTTGELDVNKDLTIEAPGADAITVSGNNASRVFNVGNFTVAISGLTVAGGATHGNGGGLYNAETLTIIGSVFSGNSASFDESGLGSQANGGGIYNAGTLTITNSDFTGNSAKGYYVPRTGAFAPGDGGGIYNAGSLTITSSDFTGNHAQLYLYDDGYLIWVDPGAGGGIYNAGRLAIIGHTSFEEGNGDGSAIDNEGRLTATASTFSGDIFNGLGSMLTVTTSTFSGGGISNEGALAVVMACTFSGNHEPDSGGAINNEGTMIVSASTFNGNSPALIISSSPQSTAGGAITNEGTLTVTTSTFSANSADDGGGIYNDGMLTVTASTFCGNSAGFGGGIANYPGGTLMIACSTFTHNTANYYHGGGGGIANAGTLTIFASTFSMNSAAGQNGTGGGIANDLSNEGFSSGTLEIRNTLIAGNTAQSAGQDVFGPITSLGHNIVGIGDGGSGYAATDLIGTATSPIGLMLGPLQDNGGPTWTMALLPGSPAIGAGGPTDSEWDQRGPGYARSVNGMTDIGAYQVQPSGASAAALSLRPSELIQVVPVVSLSGPFKLSVPLRQAAVAVDGVFASWSSEAVGIVAGRSQHAAGTDLLWWAVAPLPV